MNPMDMLSQVTQLAQQMTQGSGQCGQGGGQDDPEVAPLSWTPHCLGFWSPQWQRSTHLTRRNSAGR
jgi:hypothetical protein